ncbi:1,6-anhydro-N-acetylmuramyl-L-alanine amidase AmpD [Piscinibacter sp. Jin2]|uniref:1,6-anhydro-N-acetylmuramyl-L-alanine amidase AmpD n=1 Tax=Aquariibacter lacus TaxID=2801332 RepID=A0A9X0XC81_9BURK|nr:1,6-anhydro-N-acetylmuramyl-L-alanine amidase AmpD [Piscinibacter lacus]
MSGPRLVEGWWSAAARRPSPHWNARPPGAAIELALIHSISLPAGVYGGDAIERLFAGTLDPAAHPSFEPLRGLEVSAHVLLRRDGSLLQFVPLHERAWHAGRSVWRGRPNVNDVSVGIELEGLEGLAFEPAQYAALAGLLRGLARALPLREVVGHQHVAPVRKGDPGPGFDWLLLQGLLGPSLPCLPAIWPAGELPPAGPPKA